MVNKISSLDVFNELLLLDQDARRAWLIEWMARHQFTAANQAAPVLAVSRQTVERMLYDNSSERTKVSNQTLRIAYLIDELAIAHST